MRRGIDSPPDCGGYRARGCTRSKGLLDCGFSEVYSCSIVVVQNLVQNDIEFFRDDKIFERIDKEREIFLQNAYLVSTRFCIDVIRSRFKIIVQGRFSKKITISFDYVENLLFPAIVSRVHSLELVYHLITSRVNVLTRYKSEA